MSRVFLWLMCFFHETGWHLNESMFLQVQFNCFKQWLYKWDLPIQWGGLQNPKLLNPPRHQLWMQRLCHGPSLLFLNILIQAMIPLCNSMGPRSMHILIVFRFQRVPENHAVKAFPSTVNIHQTAEWPQQRYFLCVCFFPWEIPITRNAQNGLGMFVWLHTPTINSRRGLQELSWT